MSCCGYLAEEETPFKGTGFLLTALFDFRGGFLNGFAASHILWKRVKKCKY